jgi:hypothetical protein
MFWAWWAELLKSAKIRERTFEKRPFEGTVELKSGALWEGWKISGRYIRAKRRVRTRRAVAKQADEVQSGSNV